MENKAAGGQLLNRKSVIPNAFTLANLLVGLVSLVFTMNGDYDKAAIMVLFAMILDGMDGRLARRLEATSPFGKELDSLCDVVSFGVAPAILVYAAVLQPHFGGYSLLIALAFALSGAVRLARFNVMNITTHFVGVPITAAGSFMALLILLKAHIPAGVFAGAMALLAYLMVSNLKVPKY